MADVSVCRACIAGTYSSSFGFVQHPASPYRTTLIPNLTQPLAVLNLQQWRQAAVWVKIRLSHRPTRCHCFFAPIHLIQPISLSPVKWAKILKRISSLLNALICYERVLIRNIRSLSVSSLMWERSIFILYELSIRSPKMLNSMMNQCWRKACTWT